MFNGHWASRRFRLLQWKIAFNFKVSQHLNFWFDLTNLLAFFVAQDMFISKLYKVLVFPLDFEEGLATISLKKNWILSSKLKLFIPISLQPDVVNLWYFKLRLVALTKFGVELEISKVYGIGLQRYWDYNKRVCGKDSTPSWELAT